MYLDRIKLSKEKVIQDLKEKNIPFELIGDDYVCRSKITTFKCLNCGAIKHASAHNIIINGNTCTVCGKKKKHTYENFCESIKKDGYELLTPKEEFITEKSEFNVNILGKFRHSCGTEFELYIRKFLESQEHCPLCKKNARSENEFLKKINSIYGDLFSLVEGTHYINRRSKVSLLCKKCNHITTDYAFNFITNHRGCNFCNKPLKEQMVLNHYDEKIESKIKYNDLKMTLQLSYDFKKNDILLEIDGLQHFSPNEFFGGEEQFKDQVNRDKFKNQFAIDNNLYLIRIFNKEILDNNIDTIFDSSTTIETLDKRFSNILVIKDKKILLNKGYYINSEAVNTLKQVEI